MRSGTDLGQLLGLFISALPQFNCMLYICFQEVSKFSACLNLPGAYQGDGL